MRRAGSAVYGSDQYPESAIAAVTRRCVAKGEHFMPSTEPRFYQFTQYRLPARGATATAMHDAQATLAGSERLGEETRDLFVRLMAIHAVEVEVILDAPAAATQIPQHCTRQPVAQEGFCPAQVQPVIDRERRVQRFAKYGSFVAFALARARNRLWRLKADAAVGAQRCRSCNCRAESGEVVPCRVIGCRRSSLRALPHHGRSACLV